ncbi:MAG: S1 RNA-binding domain-containing protein, partial [Bacteroidia bacterium]|nr:S1 RNA-binding domain-containing protein [Bacteroidia bacterium]
MTESKKKTTKKEVVEKSKAPVKKAKKAKAKVTKGKKETTSKTVASEEVTAIVAEEPQKVKEVVEPVKEEVVEPVKEEVVEPVKEEVVEPVKEEVIEPVKEEVIEAESGVKKEKRPKKTRPEPEPEPEPEKEIKVKAETRSVASAEDFDWDNFESEESHNSPKYKEYESLYDETLSTVAVDEVVIGTVIQMTLREVVINIGYKSEGVVSLNEFRYNPNLKVGDKVEVYVESQEDKKGQLLLSHKKARAINSCDRVNASLEKDEIITGYIKCRTKGGMIVDVFGIEAFLPGSQIDVKPIRDYDVFVGKTMEFKVVKINQEFKNVVVSHKALIEAELEQQKKEIIAKLEKGQVLEGTVKNITSYGVFIDLGGVDGLIHITDLSWGRVNHPEEIVKLDQKLNVVILDFDDDKKRIALGLKQLTSHPWDSVDPNMNIGDKVKGKVVVMAD